MAYTVVLERENAAPAIRWKWYVARADSRRTVKLREGASPTCEEAGEDCDVAFHEVQAEIERRKMERSRK